jgi:hypothetical protein
MTRLLAVAALAALITGCATPYGPHAQGGMRGMRGMQAMHGEGHGCMHECMQDQQAMAPGMQKMCEAHSGPAAEGGAPQHQHQH